MTTVRKIITGVRGMLQSWSVAEQSATLSSTIGAADVTFSVGSARGIATGISPGIIEIDSELLFVTNLDTANGNCTVPPWGRGFNDTTAATHLAGSRVISQPAFPRAKVLDAINGVLDQVYPSVFAIKQIETTVQSFKVTYALPDDAERVLFVRWMSSDGRNYWTTAKRWRMSPGGGTLTNDTGKTIDIRDRMQQGQPLQIVYAARPGKFTSESDDFETVSGLTSGLEDVVSFGAAADLVVGLELSRLQTSSIEQQNRSQLVGPSAALTSSRFLGQIFQQRLEEERRKLYELYPPRITRSWP